MGTHGYVMQLTVLFSFDFKKCINIMFNTDVRTVVICI